jgi:hypothetical protein
MLRATVLFLAVCLFPLAAAAEESETSTHCGAQETCTEYFMDGEQVEGDFVRPDGDLMSSRGRIHTTSLIRVRSHYMDLLRKSVEDI